jgi:hypothetical protein
VSISGRGMPQTNSPECKSTVGGRSCQHRTVTSASGSGGERAPPADEHQPPNSAASRQSG